MIRVNNPVTSIGLSSPAKEASRVARGQESSQARRYTMRARQQAVDENIGLGCPMRYAPLTQGQEA